MSGGERQRSARTSEDLLLKEGRVSSSGPERRGECLAVGANVTLL